MRWMDELFGLFPTPFLRSKSVLNRALVQGLIDHFAARATTDNNTSPRLTHTEMLSPGDSPLFVEAAQAITPKLVDFGMQLFGERLGWSLKEMWVNVLETGGHQAMHNHANSFISGVVYLTKTHPGSQTVFMKSPGGTDFAFRNDHGNTTPNRIPRRQMDQPGARPGRSGAVPELPDARRAAQSGRAAHHLLPSMRFRHGWTHGDTSSASAADAAAADGGLRVCRAGLPGRLDSAECAMART